MYSENGSRPHSSSGYQHRPHSASPHQSQHQQRVGGNHAQESSTMLVFCIVTLVTFMFVISVIFYSLFIVTLTALIELQDRTNCTKVECVLAAAMIIRKMNASADPCTDFYEYACGGFTNDALIDEGHTEVSVLTIMTDHNVLMMRDIITAPISADQPAYLQNMKRLYMSCLDTDQIETNGLYGYLRRTVFTRDWPTLTPSWSSRDYSWNSAMRRYAMVYIHVLFDSSVRAYLNNINRKLIYMYPPRDANDAVLIAYHTYLADTAIALGASPLTAQKDAADVIALETALAKIIYYATARVSDAAIRPITFSELSRKYPDLQIGQAIKAAFSTAKIAIADSSLLVNLHPSYFGNLTSVLRRFSNRTIQNLFGFKYALAKVGQLTIRMRHNRYLLDKSLDSRTVEAPRWKDCLNLSSSILWMGMSKQFVARTFPASAKKYATEMVIRLKESFSDILTSVTWMGVETKTAAIKKLNAMAAYIGHPDTNFTDAAIDLLYKDYIMSEKDFYANQELAFQLCNLDHMAFLRKPTNPHTWWSHHYLEDVFYSHDTNEIITSAAMLQLPAFSVSSLNSLNYGAIGTLIGQMIATGFGTTGSQYNEVGSLDNWWQKEDQEKYNELAECLVQQYSRFPMGNKRVNGTRTLESNVADNGGLQQSFKAYQNFVKYHGLEQNLQGLALSQNQLFFLGFSQMFCSKMTNESFIESTNSGVYSPVKYRVIGSLQNLYKFAEVYKCKAGSYMNPSKKCSVW